MRKHFLLLLFFAFGASAVQAQSRDLYWLKYHDMTGHVYCIYNSMQQRDGDYIIDTHLMDDNGNYEYTPLGYMFYKVSSSNHAITDSLFVANTSLHATCLTRDPRGEGNIRAAFEYHEDCDSSFVRISHFPDNDLHADSEQDVVVPICEGDVWNGKHGFLIDSRSDLIMTYYKMRTETTCDQYIARIGLDGTLKRHALLAEGLTSDIGPLRVLKESPLQYYQWDEVANYPIINLAVYVIDSLFHRNTVILNGILSREVINSYITVYERLSSTYDTEVIPIGGDDVLVAAQYTHDTNFLTLTEDEGVVVAKYDIRTMQMKGYVVFNDFHWFESRGFPMGLKMMSDGSVYFMYKEHGYPEESVNIVKMDVNLNVEWKRFCKTGNIYMSHPFDPPIVLDDGAGEEKGVAWCGYGWKDGNYDRSGWVYFFLNHDGSVNDLSEFGIEVRPYNFYPNPAQSELHLNYSPDVTPTQIELYDLQGRLVRSQRNGLESLNIEGLASGTYTMCVTLEDGKMYSDKVVKE